MLFCHLSVIWKSSPKSWVTIAVFENLFSSHPFLQSRIVVIRHCQFYAPRSSVDRFLRKVSTSCWLFELHIVTPKTTVILILATTRISNLTRMRSDCRKHCYWIRKIHLATFMMPLCLYKAASARYWPLEDTQMLNETQPCYHLQKR